MAGNMNWPPELEEAYQKWLAENEDRCLCLNCLQARLRKARKSIAGRAALKETSDEG